MKAPFIKREEQFLKAIAEYQDIGFGRMAQIVSFAYHQYDPMSAFVVGTCFGMLPPEDREAYLKTKLSDPLDYSIIDSTPPVVQEMKEETI